MFGMEIEGLEKINKDWYIIPGYHCSGHATPTQLDEIVRALNPEIIIPVHTQDRTWFTRFDDISEVVV
jgi:mRNA degradation ribonuclease J1/J2